MKDLLQFRYNVEHKITPISFYKNPKSMIRYILKTNERGNYMFDLYRSFCEKNGIENPYKSDDFSIYTNKKDDVYYIVFILPEPPRAPLCSYVMVVFTTSFDKCSYYTLEKNFFDSTKPFLCKWNKDGSRVNLGNRPSDINSFISSALMDFSK